jgi:hypothetical protein
VMRDNAMAEKWGGRASERNCARTVARAGAGAAQNARRKQRAVFGARGGARAATAGEGSAPNARRPARGPTCLSALLRS